MNMKVFVYYWILPNLRLTWYVGVFAYCVPLILEPRHEKTGLRGFRPGPTQTGLFSHRSRLEAWNLAISRRGIVLSRNSENKGANQLRSYCEADLRLCFRIGKNPVFSRCGSVVRYRVLRLLLDFSFTYYTAIKLTIRRRSMA